MNVPPNYEWFTHDLTIIIENNRPSLYACDKFSNLSMELVGFLPIFRKNPLGRPIRRLNIITTIYLQTPLPAPFDLLYIRNVLIFKFISYSNLIENVAI